MHLLLNAMRFAVQPHGIYVCFLTGKIYETDAGFTCPVKYYTPGHASATSAHVMAHKIPMPQKNVA